MLYNLNINDKIYKVPFYCKIGNMKNINLMLNTCVFYMYDETNEYIKLYFKLIYFLISYHFLNIREHLDDIKKCIDDFQGINENFKCEYFKYKDIPRQFKE